MPVIPKTTKALVIRQDSSGKKPVYHDAILEEQPIAELKPGHVLVKINAAAYNHRDLWQRKGQYPGIAFGSTFGSDGAGVVVASADNRDSLLNKRVFLAPMSGWDSDPDAPGDDFIMIGGTSAPAATFRQYVAVKRDQVIPSPEHLDDEHTAAWPLGGLTSWRAAVVNAQVQKGENILITGVGGGVALLALQICVARGANVYVTSGSEEKIRRAIELGAKGGVNYKDKDWPKQLEKLLAQHNGKGAKLSAAIDSAGGEIMAQLSKVLKSGGKVVVYGMTASPKISFTMREVLKNQRLIGSTMGSHKDLIDATNFISQHKIVPAVSHVLDGLESAEEGFKLLEQSAQFGKVVIRIRHEDTAQSKL